jgi:multiple sugar transport system permease protein
MIVTDTFAWGPLMAGSIIATVPIIILYMFASRYLISGMTLGGVKG